MKTLSMTQMLAGALALTVVLMFGAQRQAQAGDTGRIIAAAIVGAIVYEALDDDDGWCRAKHKHASRCYHSRKHYDRARSYRGTRSHTGWNTPLPYRSNDYRYNAPRRTNRYDVVFRDNDCGRRGHTQYQAPGRRGHAQYQAPGRRAKVKVRGNGHGTRVNFQYRGRGHR